VEVLSMYEYFSALAERCGKQFLAMLAPSLKFLYFEEKDIVYE
jgi:hypothetical protein